MEHVAHSDAMLCLDAAPVAWLYDIMCSLPETTALSKHSCPIMNSDSQRHEFDSFTEVEQHLAPARMSEPVMSWKLATPIKLHGCQCLLELTRCACEALSSQKSGSAPPIEIDWHVSKDIMQETSFTADNNSKLRQHCTGSMSIAKCA